LLKRVCTHALQMGADLFALNMKQQKVALVTGAAQGIGAGIAKRMAADGYTVVAWDRTPAACEATAAFIRAQGRTAYAVGGDVADPTAVATALAEIVERIGPPQVLVNNAGFARDVSFETMTLPDWEDVIDVHLRGSFLLVQGCLSHMKAAGWGRIINISSISAKGHALRANYCAAKAGMHGFIKSLSVELGPYGITANAVAPGLIVTAMTTATAARKGLSLDQHLAHAVQGIPVGRTGTPEDIAHAVSFFASEGAGFVTGQVLYVAGMPVD
jgi:3-oxoacyl-[acyl-carrier protein] reductase